MTPVKPWAEMTWQERREERFKRWLEAPGVKFAVLKPRNFIRKE